MSDFESGLASQVRLLPGEQVRRSERVSDSEVYAGKPAGCAQYGAHAVSGLTQREPGWALRELEDAPPAPEYEVGPVPSMAVLCGLYAILTPALGLLGALLFVAH